MVIVWRLRGNIIRTALYWIVWHSVHSPQHTYVSSSYRSNRFGLSHWDPYTVRRGGCLVLYYCNMVEWFWWDSSLISTTSWFPSVFWHCWFGHLIWPVKIVHEMTYYVSSGTLNPTHSQLTVPSRWYDCTRHKLISQLWARQVDGVAVGWVSLPRKFWIFFPPKCYI